MSESFLSITDVKKWHHVGSVDRPVCQVAPACFTHHFFFYQIFKSEWKLFSVALVWQQNCSKRWISSVCGHVWTSRHSSFYITIAIKLLLKNANCLIRHTTREQYRTGVKKMCHIFSAFCSFPENADFKLRMLTSNWLLAIRLQTCL